jgi:hypothetical protein
LFFFHQAYGFVGELIGVVDGDDARLRCEKCSGFSGGVNRDVLT